MGLAFRNIDASPADPVESWPAEAVQTALERGGLRDWRRLAVAVEAQPWGSVARRVEEALAADPPYGVGPLMVEVIVAARARAEASERAEVAAEIGRLVADSGLTQTHFARRIGTSASRLSTYIAGTVTPSAALMVRMRRLAAKGLTR